MSDDWVMVPREPTIRMLAEGEHAMDRLGWERFTKAVWERMLDAAPSVPQEQAEPVAWVDVLDRDEGPYRFHGQMLLPRGKHSLYLHPPAAEVQRLRDAATRLVALWNPARPESASVVADAIDKLCRELEGQ